MSEIIRQDVGLITIDTAGVGFFDVTAQIAAWIRETRISRGLLTIFCRHTSASLTIQENADPDVLADLGDALGRLAPETAGWRHDAEGPDDMPAHVRSMITGVNLSVPVDGGGMLLGTWQGIYLVEHRRRPHRRQIALHILGA